MLKDLPLIQDALRRRSSSFDRTGGNRDFVSIPPGGRVVLADIIGPGRITHLWCTLHTDEAHALRKLLLAAWWDGEEDPSILVPLGDFFGCGHAMTTVFDAGVLSMSPQDGRGFNCFFPMPFHRHARLEVINEGSREVPYFYYYVDYELAPQDPRVGYFHALWNRQNPTDGISEEGLSNDQFQMEGTNPTGEGNYVILRAQGRGHYVGCVLSIFNLRRTSEHNWYGEGDDMIFIDGDPAPTLHGTGCEDYFNMAFCPTQRHVGPYHGLVLPGGPNWEGPISLYRFHLEDPVHFRTSIAVTIEHGHANRRSDDYSSVAYWYQLEPHVRPWPMAPVELRIPHQLPLAPA